MGCSILCTLCWQACCSEMKDTSCCSARSRAIIHFPRAMCMEPAKRSKQFALNLRADVLGSNVRVTNIEPGLTDTDFMLVRFGGDAAKKERFNQGLTPMTAEDIAEAIFWSCTLPRNVNINRIQMMPITQAFSPFARSGGPTPVH